MDLRGYRSRILHGATVGLAGLILVACGTAEPPPAAGPALSQVHRAGIFTVYGADSEAQAMQDVAAQLQSHAPRVCRDLEFHCETPIRVELFPDQKSLDQYGMNPRMKGYYAYSGARRIQMVSPRHPAPGMDIAYADRVLIAVHEFVHTVNNEVNPDMPLWLNEGVAVYVGPHDLYAYVCQHRFPFGQVPAFSQMEKSYASVPAADLFAYSLVEFIAGTYGREALNSLIRRPGALEQILGVTRSELEQGWRQYISEHYANGGV